MRGVIVCLRAGLYTVYCNKKFYQAKASGILRHQQLKPKVGDYVTGEFINEQEAYITGLEKRTNELVRPPIANIDQALVIFSVKEPDLNTNLLDRILTILNFNQLKAIIVFTKVDLLTDQQILDPYFNYYQKLGYQVEKISVKTADLALKSLIRSYFTDKITVLVGQSGVGKSSLLNSLYDHLDLNTDQISLALNRGKHTTRHLELHQLTDPETGEVGWVADTPGFGITNFFDMSLADLAHSFSEFFELSSKCKYNGCLHRHEPDCAVKTAVKNQEIIESRYQNYLLFCEEIIKQRKW